MMAVLCWGVGALHRCRGTMVSSDCARACSTRAAVRSPAGLALGCLFLISKKNKQKHFGWLFLIAFPGGGAGGSAL